MSAGSFNPRSVLLATLLSGSALLAAAETMVQRSPHTAPNTVQTLLGSGLQSLNLEETAFVSDKGVSIVSKTQADDGNGVIRVYSAIDSRGVSGIPDALTGLALGQVLAQGTVVGPVGGGAVDLGFAFDFDGTFHTYGGNVFHQLGATLSVALPSTTVPGSNVEHVASMDFRTDLLDAAAIKVFGKTEKRYFAPGFVYTVENFEGASFTVDTRTMERVAGTVRLDMSLPVGQSFILVANLFASTSPEPLIPVSGGLNYSESWGAVDGWRG